MTGPKKKNSLVGNILIGLFFIAAGIFPMLATFNIGPLGIRDINGPAWLGLAAGGIFVAAGCIVLFGESAPAVKKSLGLLIIFGLTAIVNWIAFGLGDRVCSGSFSLFGFFSESSYTDLACRIPFGIAALIMNGILFYSVIALLQEISGGPPQLAGLLKLAQWVVLISLAPILVPFLLVLIGRGALDAVRIRIKTGSWPRNETFIKKREEKKIPPAS